MKYSTSGWTWVAFLANLFEDHPWQAVPDLPRPLASLWSHPGQIGGEKPALVGNKFGAKYICQSDLS